LLELKIEDLSTGRIKPTANGETPAANQPRVLPFVQSESGVPRVRGGQEQQDADRRASSLTGTRVGAELDRRGRFEAAATPRRE
jgi:hypothetical protein